VVSGANERERVRHALIDLCFERGFRNTTLEALLERAAIDRRAFERNYSDLEDCFCAVYGKERDLIIERFVAASASATTWRDRVRAVAYSLHRSLSSDERFMHFMVIEVRAAGERAQVLQWEGVQVMFDLLEEGRAEMDDPERITRTTAESIAGGIFNQIYAAAGKGSLPPAEEVVPQMMHLVVLPYLGPEAAREELDIPPPPNSSDQRR
jgi:AcrR family transcriptional regulator